MDFMDAPPPLKEGYKYDWNTIVEELKANPGKWAVVEAQNETVGTKGAANGAARSLKRGEVGGAKPGEFDAVTRGATIYARYKGESGGTARG